MATHTDTNNMCAMKQILILLFLLLSLNAYSQEEADSTDARLLSDITYKAELSARLDELRRLYYEEPNHGDNQDLARP